MAKKMFNYFAYFCTAIIFETSILYCQIIFPSLSEVTDSSSLIIIAKINYTRDLSQSSIDSITNPGNYGVSIGIDGTLYSVQVLHVLKGDSNTTNIEILVSTEEESGGGELPPIILHEGKEYLLFLYSRKPLQLFTDKYELIDSLYYAPLYWGLGTADINQSDELEILRRTEQYLNVPSFQWRMKTIPDWIELLKARLQSWQRSGTIGDVNFVNNLVALLNDASNKIKLGDSVNCANIIQKVGNMIDGARWGFDRIRFVSTDSSSSLSSDISYIRFLLPDIPEGMVPHLDSLTIGTAYAGGPSFTLTITGEDFERGVTAYWNWSARTTTFISPTHIQVNIVSQDIVKADTATIAVVNPNGATHGADFIVLPSTLQLIDTLINRTNTALAQNWIGNANFVKELTSHLANAKKHLDKQDSINCRKEIETFQSKVEIEYKDTNMRDHRFVTVEGWKFLYYNAQYIIDRLPGKEK